MRGAVVVGRVVVGRVVVGGAAKEERVKQLMVRAGGRVLAGVLVKLAAKQGSTTNLFSNYVLTELPTGRSGPIV